MEEAGMHLLGRQPLELQNMMHFPFCLPRPRSKAEHFQVQDVLLNRLFFLNGWLQTKDLNYFNSNSCHFFRKRKKVTHMVPKKCVRMTVKWQREPFDYQPITLWLFLPWAWKSSHRVPHLFVTAECSEVRQAWTVILSQRQRHLVTAWGKGRRDWALILFNCSWE